MYATIQLVHRTIHTCKMTNIITQISMAGKRWECSGGFSWSGGTAWRGAKNYEGQPFLIYVHIIVYFFIMQKVLLVFNLKLKTFRWAWQTWQVKLPWDLSSIANSRRIQCWFNQSGFLDKKKNIFEVIDLSGRTFWTSPGLGIIVLLTQTLPQRQMDSLCFWTRCLRYSWQNHPNS